MPMVKSRTLTSEEDAYLPHLDHGVKLDVEGGRGDFMT